MRLHYDDESIHQKQGLQYNFLLQNFVSLICHSAKQYQTTNGAMATRMTYKKMKSTKNHKWREKIFGSWAKLTGEVVQKLRTRTNLGMTKKNSVVQVLEWMFLWTETNCNMRENTL